MGRKNNSIGGVFVNIVGSDDIRPRYDSFMNDMLSESTKLLSEYEKVYNGLITKNRKTFERLGMLEMIILQMRVLEDPKKDIGFYILNDYIYARCPFYRMDVAKDIRVIVGNTKIEGRSIPNFKKNPVFMSNANDRLCEAMKLEIKKSIQRYQPRRKRRI